MIYWKIIRNILLVSAVTLAFADKFIVFTPNMLSQWTPDYVRRSDGVEIVVEANPHAKSIQPHNEINKVFSFLTLDIRFRGSLVDGVPFRRALPQVYVTHASRDGELDILKNSLMRTKYIFLPNVCL